MKRCYIFTFPAVDFEKFNERILSAAESMGFTVENVFKYDEDEPEPEEKEVKTP